MSMDDLGALAVSGFMIYLMIKFINHIAKSKGQKRTLVTASGNKERIERHDRGVEFKDGKLTVPKAVEMTLQLKHDLIHTNRISESIKLHGSRDEQEMMKAAIAALNELAQMQGATNELMYIDGQSDKLNQDYVRQAMEYLQSKIAPSLPPEIIDDDDDDHPLTSDPRSAFKRREN